MSPELLVALFGTTGIASVVAIVYQIIRERRGNVQKDLAGDLSLGELFRDAARKEVALVQHDMGALRDTMAAMRALADEQAQQIRDLRRRAQECEDRYRELAGRHSYNDRDDDETDW